MTVEIRPALLDDTEAICELARSGISAWQRLNADGGVENVSYEALSIYERWLHGGPWMSVETGALQLSSLRQHRRLALVAFAGERLVGYAEAYPGTEPKPFGRHLHLARLQTQPDTDADNALMQWLIDYGRERRFARLTTNIAANDTDSVQFYQRHGLQPITEAQRMTLTTRSGQVFYRAQAQAGEADTHGWQLSIGREGNAAHQWDTRWRRTWDAVPQIAERGVHRIRFNAAGNDAYVLLEQQRYRPRVADVYCWTPKPLSGQLVSAIRDWAERGAYRRLVMLTVADAVGVLGPDAEPDGYREVIYALDF